MKIRVKVKPGASIEKVERINQPELGLELHQSEYQMYLVQCKALPEDGKANKAVAVALAKYFGVAPSCVHLDSGAKAQIKMFRIDM